MLVETTLYWFYGPYGFYLYAQGMVSIPKSLCNVGYVSSLAIVVFSTMLLYPAEFISLYMCVIALKGEF